MSKATIRLYPWELASMGEYSSSLPTGQTLWKMWKRKIISQSPDPRKTKTEWLVGQYVPYRDSKFIGIRWHKITLRQGPKPRRYDPPDWDNTKRWKADYAKAQT